MATCEGTTKKGDACQMEALPDSEFCRFHNEDEDVDPEAEVSEGEGEESGPEETTVQGPSEATAHAELSRFHGEVVDGQWLCSQSTRGKACTTRYDEKQLIAQRNHLRRAHRLKV